MDESRLEKLKHLEEKLSDALDIADEKNIASIARQYRETIREIEEIEGSVIDDEVSNIIQRRISDGKPGAVR